MTKLTDSRCKNIKPTDKEQKIFDGAGLFLKIKPNGSKSWHLKYRYAGKEKLLSFGTYPIITLSDARNKSLEAKKMLAENIDPSLIKKIEKNKLIDDSDNTFEKIARTWHEKQKGYNTPNYWQEKIHRLEKDIFPKIGNFPIDKITAPILLKVIQDIENRGAFEMAKRALQMCSQIFNYAIASSLCSHNPTQHLKQALQPKTTTNYNSIAIHEIPDFIKVVNQNKCRLYPTTLNAIKLMMLTFVRTGELIGAKWNEFNFNEKQWIIPASRMKMRKEHIVPLSRQAIEILQEQKQYGLYAPEAHVFPSQIKHNQSMSNNTILKALDRLGYKGKMTGHGFRSLAMTTIIEKLGYREKIPDLQLAHGERNRVMASYNRSELLAERTKMMQEYADYLEGLR